MYLKFIQNVFCFIAYTSQTERMWLIGMSVVESGRDMWANSTILVIYMDRMGELQNFTERGNKRAALDWETEITTLEVNSVPMSVNL